MEAYLTIPQIEVAVGENFSVLLFRHLEPLSESDKKMLYEFGHDFKIHIFLQPKGPDSIEGLYPPNFSESLYYRLSDFNVQIFFQPTDFTQINTDINVQMVKRAIELLDIQKTDRILDLFCGLGNFSLPMARFCHEVVAVEGSLEMVNRAKKNAEFNQIDNVKFYAEDLQIPLPPSDWTKFTFDKILLDPPRSGALSLIPWIAEQKISRIVYISCNPATLARDIGEFVNKYGYRFEAIGVLDMFPQTTHVESIALLTK